MREIKFRSWDESQKYMAYQGSPDLETIQSFMHHFGDKELMQFTGLKDKKGVDIYEGDLLSDPYPIDEDDLSKGYNESLLPVIWCNEKLRWSIDTSFAKDGTHLTSLVDYFGDYLEVKGNAYDKGEAK